MSQKQKKTANKSSKKEEVRNQAPKEANKVEPKVDNEKDIAVSQKQESNFIEEDTTTSFFDGLIHIFDNKEKDDIDLYPTFKAINTRPSKAYLFTYFTLVLMIVVFLVWSYFSEVDAYVSARGEVETFSKTSSLSMPVPKVIAKVHVREGQRVEKGQLLITFDKDIEEANKASIERQYYANLAEIIRLEAQLSDQNFEVPTTIKNFSRQLAKDTYDRYLNEVRTLQDSLDLLEQKTLQKKAEIQKINEQIKVYSQKVKLASDQVKSLKDLEKKKLVTRLRLIESQKDLVDDQIALDSLEADLPRAQSELKELEIQESQLISTYKSEIREQLQEARNASAQLQAGVTGSSKELARSQISAPIDAIVFRIPNSTASSAIQAGEEIISLIPLHDNLIVEARVRPEDIGLLEIGQPANVKITAYDFAIYGTLDGEVMSLSPETYEDTTTGKPYFKVKVKTNRNYLTRQQRKFYISPGMVADVDVVIDKRTVLQYITNPFIKTVRESLGEK